MEDHGVLPRDWITVGMAGLPSDSLPSPGVASPENASPDSAGLLTVSVSNLRFKTATTPRFVGKGKVSWQMGLPLNGKVVVMSSRPNRGFGTHWISRGNAGVDLPTLKELMGHSTITMTMRYVHPTPEHKLEAVRKLEQFNAEQLFALYEQKGSLQKSPQSATN